MGCGQSRKQQQSCAAARPLDAICVQGAAPLALTSDAQGNRPENAQAAAAAFVGQSISSVNDGFGFSNDEFGSAHVSDISATIAQAPRRRSIANDDGGEDSAEDEHTDPAIVSQIRVIAAQGLAQFLERDVAIHHGVTTPAGTLRWKITPRESPKPLPEIEEKVEDEDHESRSEGAGVDLHDFGRLGPVNNSSYSSRFTLDSGRHLEVDLPACSSLNSSQCWASPAAASTLQR